MSSERIVPDDFHAPESYEASVFRLELLDPRHNEADHAAWMSSIPHIRATPGFVDRRWPPESGMTLEQNLSDLVSHADRSARGVDFAYSVLDRSSPGRVIGCVYFNPTPAPGEVEAVSWVTADSADLDRPLTEVVTNWLADAWPFPVVHYRLGRRRITLGATY